MTEITEIKKAEKLTPMIQHAESLSENVITKCNCKLCNSPFRIEAEEIYEQMNSAKYVWKWLLGKGEKICYLPVRNHIIQHYLKQEQNVKIKSYSEHLKVWVNQKIDKKSSIEERIAMLNNELIIIASETEGLSLEERRRSSEAIRKITDSILMHEEKLDAMDKSIEPIYVVINKLRDIIAEKIKKSSNEEVKKELMSLLEELSASLGDLMI
jgi:hypothetical protein